VGGGCTKEKCSLPDISLSWMLGKASQCGLRLKNNWQQNLKKDALANIHDSCHLFPWVILGLRKRRKIPDGTIIHQSVIDRMSKKKDYHPVLPVKRDVVS
jgi:hypothetical protein